MKREAPGRAGHFKPRRATSLLLSSTVTLLIAGCAGTPAWDLPESHPANPRASEAPPPPPSDTLRVTATADARPEPVAAQSEPDAPAAGAAYTCPHHPEVRQDTPGECPKCGMELVAQEPIHDGHDGHSGHGHEDHTGHEGHGGHGGHQ